MAEQKNNLPRHLLVLRASAMGDVAMLPHAVRALKSAYPDIRITVATRKQFEPFFDGVDVALMPLDYKQTHHGFRGIVEFVRQVRRCGVDAVADTHFVIRSILVSAMLRLMGIRVAHIRKGKVEKWFRMGYSRADAVPLKHSVVRYCDTFRRLGFVFDDPAPITLRPQLANPAGEKPAGERWVGFAPFSAHDGKTYPADMRGEVVALLAARFERVFLHSGGGRERDEVIAIAAKYPNVTAVYELLGGDLRREIALLSHLDCVVSMDSLVMHLCALTATPTVTVWGATHPEFGFTGYGSPAEGRLQVELPCRPCSTYGKKPCKYGDVRCLRAITPQMIADKVSLLLDNNP